MLNLRTKNVLRNKEGETMKKKSLIESLPVLILLGLLAGAMGGLGIGMVQSKAASSSASAAK